MARTSAKVHPTWRKALSLACAWEEVQSRMNESVQPAKKFLICLFNAEVSSLCSTKPPKAFRAMLVLSPVHTPPFSNLNSRSCTLFFLFPLSVYFTRHTISKIVNLSFVVQSATVAVVAMNCKVQIAIYL